MCQQATLRVARVMATVLALELQVQVIHLLLSCLCHVEPNEGI